MNEWRPTIWWIPFTDADKQAFRNPLQINSYFGLPLPQHSRVFSRSLNEEGLSNVHDAGKKFREHYFGNTMALRHIKQRYPDAWIWDERFRFTTSVEFAKAERIIHAQKEFVRVMGPGQILEMRRKIQDAGLDPDDKMVGRPDLAVYVPGDGKWRFIEIKIPENGDELREEQIRWLQLLAGSFGGESAIELGLVREERKEE